MLPEIYFITLAPPHHPSKEVTSFKKMISSAIYKKSSQRRIYFIVLRKLSGKDIWALALLVTIYIKYSFKKSQNSKQTISPDSYFTK